MSEYAKVEKDEPHGEGIVLFGTDIMKIECMRGSLLNGFFGAAIGAVGGLMYTGSPKYMTHTAFGSYWVVATICWFHCRYKKFLMEKNLKVMKKQRESVLGDSDYHVPRDFLGDPNSKIEKLENKG